jgi:hypothetical protein
LAVLNANQPGYPAPILSLTMINVSPTILRLEFLVGPKLFPWLGVDSKSEACLLIVQDQFRDLANSNCLSLIS